LGAVASLGVSATAKTLTYMLLRYFVDTYFIAQDKTIGFNLDRTWFCGVAAVEGGFTFLSAVLASQTAEGITRRLRNYLYIIFSIYRSPITLKPRLVI
jgi:ATP-binding cassette subfamily B protein